MVLLSIIRLRLRALWGKLFNLAGLPGFVRDCDYKAGITDAQIRVRAGEMFTVITVNGLDIYFHRLTGAIDGIGFMPDCKRVCIPESMPVPDLPVSPPRLIHKRNE